jgi:hypothetical protein
LSGPASYLGWGKSSTTVKDADLYGNCGFENSSYNSGYNYNPPGSLIIKEVDSLARPSQGRWGC